MRSSGTTTVRLLRRGRRLLAVFLAENYFSSATTRGPLTALQNGTDGANGVYRYGASGFPNSSYASSNYWVDVVFTTD